MSSIRLFFALIFTAIALGGCATPKAGNVSSNELKSTSNNIGKSLQDSSRLDCKKSKKNCEKYADDLRKAQKYTEALSFYNQACFEGGHMACRKMGEIYMNNRTNPELAAAAFMRGCNMNDVSSCNELGVLFLNRKAFPQGMKSVQKINDLGIRYIKKSCNGGRGKVAGEACHNLATIYSKGDKAPKDKKLVESNYRNACGKGYLKSCNYLGKIINDKPTEGANKEAQKHFMRFCLKKLNDSSMRKDNITTCQYAIKLSDALNQQADLAKAKKHLECLQSKKKVCE